jgi:L-amino acid N-acyltransferase YncA
MILRQATPTDAEAMCNVLNPLIARGGTTAHKTPFTPERMASHYIAAPELVSCALAEDQSGVLGFQWLGWGQLHYDLPEGWAVIASFARLDAAGKGVGRALFGETKRLARDAGAKVIDATIRSYNTSGLGYYTRMGFVDWKVTPETVSKRFDL